MGLDYDWIGFDPRGVGSSEPSLSCDGDLTTAYNRPYYVPVTRSLEKEWLARSKKYAQACANAGGALLDHVKTTDTVADMESIRKAVRRMVLDGNVDPRGVWYDANLAQDVAFDKNIGTYFAWIAKYDAVYHLGTTGKAVEKKYYATIQKLRKAPAGGVIGPDEWTDVFTSAAYYIFEWTDIADAFAAYVNDGDYAPVTATAPTSSASHCRSPTRRPRRPEACPPPAAAPAGCCRTSPSCADNRTHRGRGRRAPCVQPDAARTSVPLRFLACDRIPAPDLSLRTQRQATPRITVRFQTIAVGARRAAAEVHFPTLCSASPSETLPGRWPAFTESGARASVWCFRWGSRAKAVETTTVTRLTRPLPATKAMPPAR